MTSKRIFVFASLAILAVVSWFVYQEIQRRAALQRIPELPDFAYQNQRSIELFDDADVRARREPRSSAAVGELGMLYHAYQFHEQARACYQLAAELEPTEMQWPYYLGVVEEAEYRLRASLGHFDRVVALAPDNASAWAWRGDLHLGLQQLDEARADFDVALGLDPYQPIASSGQARMLMLEGRWEEMVDVLERLLSRYPRLSLAHKYLARAHGELGREEEALAHQDQAEYGSAADGELLEQVLSLSVPPILEGSPEGGASLLEIKCKRCHTHDRIYETKASREWWAATVRRMQRQAGWLWLTDDEAATVVAHLSENEPEETAPVR